METTLLNYTWKWTSRVIVCIENVHINRNNRNNRLIGINYAICLSTAVVPFLVSCPTDIYEMSKWVIWYSACAIGHTYILHLYYLILYCYDIVKARKWKCPMFVFMIFYQKPKLIEIPWYLVRMLILMLSFNKLIYTARQILSNVLIAVFILAISQMDTIGYNGK